MATSVKYDAAQVTLDATELALAIARGTSGPELVNNLNQALNDANKAFQCIVDISSTNTAALAAAQKKLIFATSY